VRLYRARADWRRAQTRRGGEAKTVIVVFGLDRYTRQNNFNLLNYYYVYRRIYSELLLNWDVILIQKIIMLIYNNLNKLKLFWDIIKIQNFCYNVFKKILLCLKKLLQAVLIFRKKIVHAKL